MRDKSLTATLAVPVLAVFTVTLQLPVAKAQQATVDSGFALEEVTVTARKRTERLQDTPIAITSTSAAQLADAGANDLSDASRFVPNLQLGKGGAISGSNAAAAIFIRGVGQGDFIISSDPGVGVYIDGVYYARMVGAAMELADIDRVEVARGPQGTLFGRNTIGGAVSVITKQPGPHFEGYTSVTGGQNENIGVKSAVNIPITDELYARFSVIRRERGGYVNALQYNDIKLGDENVGAYKAQLRFAHGPLDVNFSADYSRQKDHGAPWVAASIVAPGADPNFNYLFSSFANLFTGVPACQTTAGQTTNPKCFGPVWLTNNRFSTNNTWHDVATGEQQNPYSVVNNYGTALTVGADLGDVQFKSISAFRRLQSGFNRSLSETPLITFQNTTRAFDSDQYSQEFQFTGKAFDNKLVWLAGLYYFYEKGIEIDDLVTSLFRRSGDIFTVKNRSIAGFTSLTYNFTEQLHLTLGGRYTNEKKDGVGASPNFIDSTTGLPDPTYLTSTQKFNEFTPSANLSYNFTTDILGYLSYSKGYKSGTFSPRLPFPNLAGPTLPTARPEFVQSYEGGIKTDFWDNRIRVNAAAFYMHYDDIQIAYIPPSNPANTIEGNIAAAVFKGLEFEVQARPTKQLTLNGSLGLLDAHYTKFDFLPTPYFSTSTPLQRTPRYQADLAIDYRIPVGTGNIILNADWSFVAKQALFSDDANRPYEFQAAYNEGNASIGYAPQGEKWKLTVFVQNVTNEVHETSAVDVTRDTFGVAEVIYNRPRETFATFTYNF